MSVRWGRRILSDEELLMYRQDSLARDFAKLNTILSGLNCDAHFRGDEGNSGDGVPAMTRAMKKWGKWGSEIETIFSRDQFRLDSQENEVLAQGVDYHELGHIMFTPLKGLPGIDTSDDFELAIFNVVEDGRIERLTAVAYESIVPYLNFMVSELLLEENDVVGNGYVLIYGRKYLPQGVIDYTRENFKKLAKEAERNRKPFVKDVEDFVKEFEPLVDEYIELIIPGTKADETRAVEIVKAIKALFEKHGIKPPKSHMHTDKNGYGELVPGGGNKGGKGDRAEQEELQGEAKEGEGQGKGKSGGDGKGEDPTESLRSGALGDEKVQRDLKARKAGGNGVSVDTHPQGTIYSGDAPPDPVYQEMSRKYQRELEKINIQVEPGWRRRVNSGKINVPRAMTGTVDLDELFDSWNEGQEEGTRVEFVVLVDVSGSMDDSTDKLSHAVWAVKTAGDKGGHPTTVYAYDEESFLIYSAKQAATKNSVKMLQARGGTDPHLALKEAAAIFDFTEAPNRALLILTDGSWGYSGRSEQIIEKMNRSGVSTNLIYYSEYGNQRNVDKSDVNSHGCKTVNVATSPDVLIDVAKDVVTSLSRGGIRRR